MPLFTKCVEAHDHRLLGLDDKLLYAAVLTQLPDLEELKEKMGWSRKRQGLLEGLEEAHELMASCGVARVYLDGSFVTDKDRPND